MNSLVRLSTLTAFSASLVLLAQTPVTTTGGTSNRVPLFSNSSNLVNSTIYQVNGNTGINAASPTQPLFVNGTIEAANGGSLRIGGNVRINSKGIVLAASGTPAAPGLSFVSDPSMGLFRINNGLLGFATSGVERMRLNTAGFLGIGTANPSSRLTVNGVIQSLSGGVKFPDNTVQTTATAVGPTGPQGPRGATGPAGPAGSLKLPFSGVSSTGPVFTITSNSSATAIQGIGGTDPGGPGVPEAAGIGVLGQGGDNSSHDSVGGTGGVFTGGFGTMGNGTGIVVTGGAPDNGYAGSFYGDVDVQGTLFKSAGAFKIDHPLDPANKTLSHSFVESPDMMNIYNGTALLDGNGSFAVQLPDWFEALNQDFRYQLTAMGTAQPNLHVAQEITGNRFVIAGGVPGAKVSWQVTGVRHDAYAEAHRIPVEQEKGAQERAHYRHPELFGHSVNDSVIAIREPAVLPSLQKK